MPALNSLAVTDAVLCIVTLHLAGRRQGSPLLRISAALFSAAALLGVLRFSGIWPAQSVHTFVSMLAGVSAFPALAMAVSRASSPWVLSSGRATMAVVGLGAIGAAIVTLSGSRHYVDFCAVSSVLAMGVAAYRQRDGICGVSALLMLAGLLCFATKTVIVPGLEPADHLHLALAAGWLGIGYRSPSAR